MLGYLCDNIGLVQACFPSGSTGVTASPNRYMAKPSGVSQRGDSPFVYRDRGGWPASLPYICKIRVSVAIGTQSGIRLHEKVPMVKIWGSSKKHKNQTTGKAVKF